MKLIRFEHPRHAHVSRSSGRDAKSAAVMDYGNVWGLVRQQCQRDVPVHRMSPKRRIICRGALMVPSMHDPEGGGGDCAIACVATGKRWPPDISATRRALLDQRFPIVSTDGGRARKRCFGIGRSYLHRSCAWNACVQVIADSVWGPEAIAANADEKMILRQASVVLNEARITAIVVQEDSLGVLMTTAGKQTQSIAAIERQRQRLHIADEAIRHE